MHRYAREPTAPTIGLHHVYEFGSRRPKLIVIHPKMLHMFHATGLASAMAKPPPTPPKQAGRPARLAAALRANLKRRKLQARSRAETAPRSEEAKKG